jgi:ferredoxin-NADP reductase
MSVNVRGFLFDVLAFVRLKSQRRRTISRAAAQPMPPHAVNLLAQQVRPEKLHLVVTGVRDETASARTFRLAPDPDSGTSALPPFRAGQYLSLKTAVNGTPITRPYSISSAPFEALRESGFYEITLRRAEDGFLTPYAWEHWQVGTALESSGPTGTFYYEPLRDAHTIVGLAGGSGITAFRSMAREIAYGDLDAELLLLYGSDVEDILFCDELQQLERDAAGKLRVVHVLSCEPVSLQGCEQGFISADLMRKYADVENSSFFACGPQAMYRFLDGELAKLNLPRRRTRRELFGEVHDVASYPGYPTQVADRTFRLTVHMGSATHETSARAGERLLVAMERATLAPPSQCRSGECGFCRSRLISGEVFVVPDSDGRRAADKAFGYVHPCSSFPLSDVELDVPPTRNQVS